MADRQGVPTHDPLGDLLGRITAIQQRVDALEAALELMNVAPLRLVVTRIAAGPPPRYRVDLVNPATGGTVTLAADL